MFPRHRDSNSSIINIIRSDTYCQYIDLVIITNITVEVNTSGMAEANIDQDASSTPVTGENAPMTQANNPPEGLESLSGEIRYIGSSARRKKIIKESALIIPSRIRV